MNISELTAEKEMLTHRLNGVMQIKTEPDTQTLEFWNIHAQGQDSERMMLESRIAEIDGELNGSN